MSGTILVIGAAGQIGSELARQALKKAAGSEEDPYVLEEILSAISLR